MNRIGRGLKSFGAFWWDFIVGDDWRIAAGIVVAFALTALLAHNNITAWWVLPIAVLLMLGLSLREAVRKADPPK
jgi:hypothetical protein